MNTILPAHLRIPLLAALIGSLLCWGVALPAQADDPGGPVIAALEAPYPYWFSPFIGGAQDSFKTGDKTYISVEVTDTAAPVASVTADLSDVGVPEPIAIPLLLSRSETDHLYQGPITIGPRADGSALIAVTVTDTLGRTATRNVNVLIDSTPPAFSIDSFSFVKATTTPVLDDPMHVSGTIDPAASKVFVTDAHYILYDENRVPVAQPGSFKPQGIGVSLSTLGPGTFADKEIRIWFDRNTELHFAEAAFIGMTATVIDGAGNSTTASSSLIRIPKTGEGGISNVLFLPGIEGSRLIEPAPGCDMSVSDCPERKLWDPSSDSDLSELSLDAAGASVNRVYVKEGDIIDALGPFKFYRSFLEDLDAMKGVGTMNDWHAVAYDWRLSPETLARRGAQQGTHVDYAQETSTPYIEQTLRALAATSKTGKVTIIAHSAGGLVAKALLQKLGDAETARLVDDVVLVGVPQSGTPQALAGLLHGYGSALPADWCASWEPMGSFCAKNASRAQARALGANAAMIYSLLPSARYFADVIDPLHPVVSFIADHLFANERAAYGTAIDTEGEQIAFAANADGSRTKPAAADLSLPNILNANLFGSANESHSALDAWRPPASVQVYEVAGWGADTLSGIQYYEAKKASAPGGYVPRYRPQFVEDGDATVVVPSALMLPVAQNVKRYWVNLTQNIPLQPLGGASHANLFELRDLRSFIAGILAGTPALPNGITQAQPADINPRKKLLFTLHGSAQATLQDSTGNESTIEADGSTKLGVPGVQAGIFGDSSYFLAPATAYKLLLASVAGASADVDVQHIEGDTVTSTQTLEDVPAAAEVDISPDGIATTAPTAAPAPPATRVSGSSGSSRIVSVVKTKGIANSRSVLTPPKPIPVPKVLGAATTTKKKAAAPKAKPLTKKTKAALSALLDQLTTQLQGLLTKLPH